MKTITLDNQSDPEGAARRVYSQWHYALKSGFILEAQDVVERAWFHYHNAQKGTALPPLNKPKDIPGIIMITYDATTPQLKGSTPQKVITALQQWGNTREEW